MSLRTDREHPHLDSGATPIGSAGRAPDKTRTRRYSCEEIFGEKDGMLSSSLHPVTSARAQTRGLLPSGALDAHPIKLSAPPGYHPNHRLLWAIIQIIGSSGPSSESSVPSGPSSESSVPSGYHPNHRLLQDITQIIGSSWISPKSSAPPGYQLPNHQFLYL